MEQTLAKYSANRVSLTPDQAMELLEHNTLNRPLSDAHAKRIAGEIVKGRWKFNGDTIKIADDGKVLDGQHRLWACIESKRPIDTIVVHGVDAAAFSTIDTIRKSRTASDTIALMGTTRHRHIIGTALTWLIRWQRGVLTNYRQPQHRVENADIEDAFGAHPQITSAVQRAMTCRRIGNPGIFAFLYYVTANRKPELADQFMTAIEDPTGLSVSHPFFQFRAYLTTQSPTKKREPDHTIALAFKVLNAVAAGRPIRHLKYQDQGAHAEAFPELKI